MNGRIYKMDDLVHYFASNEDSTDVAYENHEYLNTYTGSPMNELHSMKSDNVSLDVDSGSSHLLYGSPDVLHQDCKHTFGDSNPLPQQLPPEVEIGNIEYKRTLVNPTPDRFEHLVTQMKWRLTSGGGSAIYRLGVDDNGLVSGLPSKELDQSVQTLQRMACQLNATIHPLRECLVPVQLSDQHASMNASAENKERKAVEFLISQSPSINDGKLDVCVALLGGVDAGKSTLIGVLTDGELDNGHGRARLNLFRHLHEVESGRTSSSTCEYLGFDSTGQVTNYSRATGALTRHSIDEVLRTSTRLISLLDLAGHYKYQRTTLSGLARRQPVAALLVVSATTGLTTVGLQHVQLALSLSLPFAVVITKVDQLTGGGTVSRNRRIGDICGNILLQISKLKTAGRSLSMTESGVNHWCNTSLDNAEVFAKRKEDQPLFFPVSSVSGFGIDRLLRFLSRLGQTPKHRSVEQDQKQQSPQDVGTEDAAVHDPGVSPQEARFLANLDSGLQKTFARQFNGHTPSPPAPPVRSCYWVNQVFTRVPGVPNPILFGTLQTGRLTLGQRVWLGPDNTGDFRVVQIMSLMRNRQSHSIISAGQTATVAIHFLTPESSVSLPAPRHHRPQGFEYLFSADDDENQPVSSESESVTLLRRGRLHQSPGRSRPPTSARRGMVLVSEAIRRSLSGSQEKEKQALAWSVDLALTSRLLTVSALNNQLAVLPPLPTPMQRIILYAGCVVQSVQVVPPLGQQAVGSGEDEDRPLDATGTPHLSVSFTRGPEFMEVGRQVIVSWAGCAIAVGYVAALHDTVRLPPLRDCDPTNPVSLPTAAAATDSLDTCESPCAETERSGEAFHSPAPELHHPRGESSSVTADAVGVKLCRLSAQTELEEVCVDDGEKEVRREGSAVLMRAADGPVSADDHSASENKAKQYIGRRRLKKR